MRFNRKSYFELDLFLNFILVISMFVLTIFAIVFAMKPVERKDLIKVDQFNIYSLEDNVESKRINLIGRGEIQGVSYFYYTKKNEDNSFEVKKAATEKSRIYYLEDSEEPYIVISKNSTSPLVKVLGFEEIFYDIYIPEGSIIEKYNVDLK